MPSVRLPGGRWEHTFSASWLTDFANCPEAARRRYYKLTPWKANEFTALGSAVHSGIEAMVNNRLEGREALFSLGGFISAAKERFVQSANEEGFKLVKYPLAKCCELIGQHLTLFANDILPGLKPVAAEVPFNLTVYSDVYRQINLRGIIDYVDETGLTDWKTAGAPHKVWEKERYDIQSTVYCWAWERFRFDRLKYVVFVHDKGIQEYEIVRTPQHVDWVRHQALAAAHNIESGNPVWTMNDQSWRCAEKWCASWSDCKGKYLGGSGGHEFGVDVSAGAEEAGVPAGRADGGWGVSGEGGARLGPVVKSW